jgi:hypothetical protein
MTMVAVRQLQIRKEPSLNISNDLHSGWALSYQMPCAHPIVHRWQHCFLPHFPPRLMRCRFSPELVTPLPHAMRMMFPMLETRPMDTSPISPPLSSLLTQTKSASFLIPKPWGEVSHVSCGGYTLKNVLEKEHGLEDGLYHKIRV